MIQREEIDYLKRINEIQRQEINRLRNMLQETPWQRVRTEGPTQA